MDNLSHFVESALHESGALIFSKFGHVLKAEQKSDPSQVVTALDVASERLLIDMISRRFPSHSIIAEESGFIDKNAEYIWVVDPIDGTSNFANGIPWFGVMIGLLHTFQPIAGGIYLPVTDELYIAEEGKGAYRNRERYVVHQEPDLKNCLVALHLDPTTDKKELAFYADVFSALLPKIRNLRSTNSVVDYAYATEGKIAGIINFNNKIWDDVAMTIIAKEAGCIITDHAGNMVDFTCSRDNYNRDFSFVLATPKTHAELLSLVSLRS